MTQPRKPWVGDIVRDEITQKQGVVSDVQGGVYLLRPERGTGKWTTESADDLTILVACEDRQHRHIPSER
jgi:hypothetical protein